MTNPLVAGEKSSTTAVSGIPLLESATDLRTAIESGDWASIAMGVVGTALDALTTVLDPFGAILAAGVGWLIEHVGPLKEALDALAGDADQVRAHAETWQNVAKELGAIGGDLATLVGGDTAGWSGGAGDAYRARGADTANLIAAAQEAASGVRIGGEVGAASGVQIGGEVVAAVRQLVRDIIAEAVGHLVSWALQVVFTLGIGLTWVVPQVVNEVAKIANRISGVVSRLIKAMKALIPLLKRAGDIFGDTSKAFRKLEVDPSRAPSGSHTPNIGGSRGLDGPSGPTGPSGAAKEPPRAKGFNDNPEAHGTPVADKSLCGDPIDVATGWMVMPQDDIELAGTLPLTISRTHLSSFRLGRWFGASWASTMDQRLEVEPDGLHLILADGTLLTYPIPVADEEVLPTTGPRFPLRRADAGYEVVDPTADRLLLFDIHLKSIMDGDGNRVDFHRAGDGTPTAISHSGGYRLTVHTENGLVTAISLGEHELMRYRYEQGRLVEVTDGNETTRFTYDEAGRIVRWVDRSGRWYRYHYDAGGRCVRTEGADGYLNSALAYAKGITTVTNSLGHTTSYHFDDRLRLAAQTDPLGNTTRYERDEWGRVLARTNPLGRTTSYERDAAGLITTITLPDGSRATREYDSRNQPTVTTGPDGAVWRREYNRRGKLVRTMDPTGAVTTYTYDPAGNVNTVTDPLGGVTGIESNAAGLPVTVTDPVGAVTRHTYDDLGRPRMVTDALGNVTTMTWDATGELRERVDPDGAVWRWHADDAGDRTIDPRGATTTAEYAHFDLLVAETGPDGGRLSYAYDTELRLVSVTNEQDLVWRYSYDPAGNLVSETDYNGRTTHYGYDAAGQLVLRGNGTGETVAFDRDELGRIVRRRARDGTAEFTYDGAGRLTSARNTDAEVLFTYDALGRLTAESINGRTVRAEYDLAGRRTTRRTPSGALSRFTYDAANRPVALHTAGRTVRFEHDLAGRELARWLSAEVELRQSWDPGDRLVTQTVRAGGRTVRHREYGYLPDGHLSRVDDTLSGPRILDVDLAGRVLAVRGRGWQESYTYSPAGTIEHARWPGAGGPRQYLGTLVMSAGDTVYAYDAEGRTVGRGGWRFDWNDDNRLTGVVTPEGQRWRYRYDALGRRICKQRIDGAGRIAQQTQFTWDGANLAEEVRDGAVATVWEWEPDTSRVVTQTRRVLGNGETEFHAVVTDLVGAPAELVDERGNVAWQARMTLWGKMLSPPGNVSTPLRFPGQYHDAETGLYYNVYRYYDPDTGRYLSHDPLGLDPSPDSMAYVGNPTAWIDPLGLTACQVAGGSGSPSGGGKKPPGQHNAQAGPGPSTTANRNKKRKRADDDDDSGPGPAKLPRQSYADGTHGAKTRAQKELTEEFGKKVSGSTHESEHPIGYEVLGRHSGGDRGSGPQQKLLENHAWAYQEAKAAHRAHIGTGNHSAGPNRGDISSQQYRDAQRYAVEHGDANTAIQINQIHYSSMSEFTNTNGTWAGQVADASYRQMIDSARTHDIAYATGPGTNGPLPRLTTEDAAETLLARDVARTHQYPTLAEQQLLLDELEGRGPIGGNRDAGGPWANKDGDGSGKGKGRANM